MIKRISLLIACTALVALTLASSAVAAATSGVPSGQRVLGRNVVEPIYDADHAGRLGFISTPMNAPIEARGHAASPIYLPVYPVGSAVGALVCPHVPVDTCPDHGPVIASLAQTAMGSVYGGGVLGHDHVTAFRGAAGFGVFLEPTVVLFTSQAAANEHLLTRSAIDAAIARGDAIAIPLPPATLHGEQVSASVWELATPIA
jgi:hypothetical protein